MPKYSWRGGNLPPIENHSLRKHKIIKDYLIDYICVRFVRSLAFSNRPWRLTIVDGFAGGGLYECHGHVQIGSPLVIGEAVREAEAKLASKYGEDRVNFDVDIICIEKNKESAKHLQDVLNRPEYAQKNAHVKTHVWPGEFGDHLPPVLQFIRKKSNNKDGKCLFILDQYGYSDVLFSQIRSILSMNSEVILTFAVDALATYLSESKYPVLRKIGFEQQDIETLQQLKNNPTSCRADIQRILSHNIFQHSKAQFYTPFLIHSDVGNWGYWLVHLSKHYKARDVMIDIHWKHNNALAHYGDPGLDMLSYDSSRDHLHTGEQMIGEEFRFDETAKAKVLDALPEDILRLWRTISGPVSFRDLKMRVSNGRTPASDEMFRTVLQELHVNREIRIPRKNAQNIQDKDVLHLRPQMVIPVPKKS